MSYWNKEWPKIAEKLRKTYEEYLENGITLELKSQAHEITSKSLGIPGPLPEAIEHALNSLEGFIFPEGANIPIPGKEQAKKIVKDLKKIAEEQENAADTAKP